MEKYNESVAENKKVEMVHISLDSNESAAERWASQAGLPWLTILPDDVERTDLRTMFGQIRGVPTYILVKADGEEMGRGSSVFTKIKEL